MKQLIYLSAFFFFILILNGCDKSGNYSNIPKIEYVGMSKSEMRQGSINSDSLWLEFKFEDGDGDLGFGPTNATNDIVVKDSRTGIIQDEFKIPLLPPSENDLQKGVLSIKILTTCCLFPDNTPPCDVSPNYPQDTLRYLIFIRDRAGHQSNVISSDVVKLVCQ